MIGNKIVTRAKKIFTHWVIIFLAELATPEDNTRGKFCSV